MKIAVLSDIHANIEALEACLQVAAHHGVSAYACLGDSVNYGADPVAALDRVMALPGLIAVLGNHDEAMFLPPQWPASSELEHSAAWTRRQLRAEHIQFLRALPYVRHAHGAIFAHATVDFPNSWEYVVEPKQAQRCFKAVPARLLFLGHVHIPGLFRQDRNGRIEEIDPRPGTTLALTPGDRFLANVGSVGQPRDGDNSASFVIYDVAAATLRFERVAYDFAAAAAKIRHAGLHPFFAERLAVGQ